MGYSLGDDKKSFDIFDETCKRFKLVCDELEKRNWLYDKNKYSFTKNNRTLKLELDQDHIESIYIYDNSINWEKFCKNNFMYEPIYNNYNQIECVEFLLSSKTDINRFINKIEQAELNEKEFEL